MSTFDEFSHDLLVNEWYASLTTNIAKYGHQLIGVFDCVPNFTYSIGLSSKYGFEIIVIGLPPTMAGALINDVAEDLAQGLKIVPGVAYDKWANLPCKFMEAGDSVRGYVCQADRYYGKNVKVLQFVIPDKEGRFSDDEGYDSEYMNPRQPLLF